MRTLPTVPGFVPGAVLLGLTFLLLCVRSAVAATDPIYLLRLLYDSTDEDADTATARWNGMKAALYAGSYTTANSQTITVIERNVGADASDSATVVTAALADYPTLLAILGPSSSAGLTTLVGSSVLADNNLVCFGPAVYASSLRVWTESIYFTQAEPKAELLLLMDYVLNTLHALRVGFMYLGDSLIGDSEYAMTVSLLAAAGQDTPTLYTATLDDTASLNTTTFDAFADADVQAILIFAPPTKQTIDFVRACLTDTRTSAAVLLGPSLLTSLFQTQYTQLSDAGTITYADNHVMNALTNVLPNADTRKHVQLFQTEMTDYIANSGTSNYMDSSYYLTNLTMGAAMLSGWITGKTLMQTLSNLDWTASASAYTTGLFQQNRYVIGSDCVVGDYGGVCDSVMAAQGAMCSCNQGGHTTYLTASVDATLTATGDSFTYPITECYAASVTLDIPLNILIVNFTNSTGLVAVTNLLSSLTDATLSTVSNTGAFTFHYATLSTPASSNVAQTALDTYVSSHAASVLYGPYLSTMDTSLLVLEPYYEKAASRILQRNVLTLRPTIEQFFYVLVGNYAALGVSTITVVLRGYTTAQLASIEHYATKTADNFNVKKPTMTSITDTADLTASLRTTGVSVLMGVVSGDAATLATFLTAHPAARVFLGPQDFYVHYDELVAAFAGTATSVQARLLFLTNLPLWTDTSTAAHTASAALRSYHAVAPTPYSPIAFELFVMTWFLESLTANAATANATALVDFVYSVGMIAAKDLVFGQFAWTCAGTTSTTAAASPCFQHNYGARDIAGMSMARVLDPTVAVTIASTTPDMTYTARSSTGLSKGQLAGIIVGSVLGGLLIIALLVYFLCFSGGGSRNNKVAPKKAEEPVTIIFTDIESSTALWAALPQLMPDAVATHHRVIRSVIQKHKCYEVKTIGDSFMIACRDAYSAVRVATEIQTKLLKYDWKTEEIDEAYRQFELKRARESTENAAPTAGLNRDVYEALWNGLRVRVGIHTGLSDIRFDEVTKGYDYYGDTSNMAARTEAIANGGQVIMTEATWWALSSEERSGLNSRAMGPQGLRGVPYAVMMYQLNPVLGRQYANLRTEIDAIVPDMEAAESSENGADELLSSNSAMSGAATAIAFVLASCFSTYPPPLRIRELQPLLSKWSVPTPPRPQNTSEEDYCRSLFNRLAVRVAKVTQVRYRQSIGGTLEANPLTSPNTQPTVLPAAANSIELRNRVLDKARPPLSAAPSGGNGLRSPFGVSVTSRLMVDVPAETDTAAPPDRRSFPPPMLSSNDEAMTAFEHSALGSTTVHTFERSQRASNTAISMEAVQRLMQGCMAPTMSSSSAALPAIQSQSGNRTSHLDGWRNEHSSAS